MNLPDHQTYLATRHFGCLDGLRFLCIAAVLWHHGPVAATMDLRLASRGFTGVDFFFVISGFLITTLLLRERASTGRISLRGFYHRRILRIVPVFFFVVTVVSAYYILAKGQTEYVRLVPFYYLFLSNYLTENIPTLGITWSLSVEEQYYVLWPLLMVLTPLRRLPWIIAGLVVLNFAAVTGMLRPLGIHPFEIGPLRFEMFAATFTPILLGSGAAILLHSRRGFDLAARWFAPPWMPLALFGAVIVLLQFLPADLIGWPNLALHVAMTAALISIVIREKNILRPFLAFPPVARIGQISYGIYLYHLLALHVVVTIGLTGWAQLIIYSALSILVAEISFRTLEAYFQRMRSRPAESVGTAPETR